MHNDSKFWLWIGLTLVVFSAAALAPHALAYDDTRKAVAALERIATALERANVTCR